MANSLENEKNTSKVEVNLNDTPEQKEERRHKRLFRWFIILLLLTIIMFGLITNQIISLMLA